MSPSPLASEVWPAFDRTRVRTLTDARLQLHHAAQLATALGISYLAPRPDDGHTALVWDPVLGALLSQPVGAVRIGVRVRDLTLLVVTTHADANAATNSYNVCDALPLHGRSSADADGAIRAALAPLGLDATRYTQRRHYSLPSHPVGNGANFDAGDGYAFGALDAAYRGAAVALSALRDRVASASDVRCWPHHFDIATLVSFAPGRSSSAGLSPGDDSYDEPYYYVNVHPQPTPTQLTDRLDGNGQWHTDGWIGAVLPASRWAVDASAQAAQATAFLTSAIAAARRLAMT